jgi:predicted nucleic acid-binding Zn ribbon protein
MSVAPDGKYEDAHFGTLSVVPEEVAEYGDASTYVPSEYATKLTTIAGSVRDKNHLLVGEGESGQARPGVFQMRGVNYRSGESTQLQEEYNNRRMPLAIAHEIVLSESPVEHGLVSAYAVEDPSLVHEAKIINVKRQRVLRILMIAVIVILVIGVVIPVVLKPQ